MAQGKLWSFCTLLLCTGSLMDSSVAIRIVASSQSYPPISQVEGNGIISAVVEPKEHLQDSAYKDKQNLSLMFLQPTLTVAISTQKTNQKKTETKYKSGNSSGITMIGNMLNHHFHRIHTIKKNLYEISEQTTNYDDIFPKNINVQANIMGIRDTQNDTHESQNSKSDIFLVQALNKLNILNRLQREDINNANNYNDNFKDKISQTQFDFTAKCVGNKCNLNENKRDKLEQQKKKLMVIFPNKVQKELGPVLKMKRVKRCVDKECEDKYMKQITGLNYLKQLRNGFNMDFTDAASDNKNTIPAPQVKGSKKCEGKSCNNANKKDDRKGLSQEHRNDILKFSAFEEEDKFATLRTLLKFGVKEIIGLILIFVIACSLIYIYMSQAYTDDDRRYVAFGTLCFFLLCLTVLSELADRAMKTANDATSA